MDVTTLPTNSTRITWEVNHGYPILIIDYSTLYSSKPDQLATMMDTIDKAEDIFNRLPEPTRILTITTGSSANSAVMKRLNNLQQLSNDKHLAIKDCVVGIEGLQKALLNMVNFFTKSKLQNFETKEAAIEYLIAS